MSISASDLLHDAGLFHRTYPNWPHAEPEADSVPALPDGPLFRLFLAELADDPDDTKFTPLGNPVDLDGLASLLRSGEDCRALRVRLCQPGQADAPLVLFRGPRSWTVFRPESGGVLAEIKFSSDGGGR